MIRVEQEKVEQAWINWLEFHYGLDCEEVMQRFCNCVDKGDNNPKPIDPWDDDSEFIEVLPEIVTRLSMLTSPHFHTYIKAWYVNNPWKSK